MITNDAIDITDNINTTKICPIIDILSCSFTTKDFQIVRRMSNIHRIKTSFPRWKISTTIKMLIFSIACGVFITLLLYQFEQKVLFDKQLISRYIPIKIIQTDNITKGKSRKTNINMLHEPKKSRKKYSSFVCLGGDSTSKINNYRKQWKAFLQHTCHFKNICYSNKQNKWLYYTPSDTFSQIIQTENDKIYYDFNTTNLGFLMIHSMKNEFVTPTIINEPFPETDRIHKMFHKTVIYHYLQWVYNFGHVLTDNFYSMYRALHYFHLYNNNTCCQPLFNYVWQAAGFEKLKSETPFLSFKFINGLAEYIFNGSKPIFLGFDSKNNHNRDFPVEKEYERLFAFNDSDNDLACFKNIVIGTDDFRVWWKAVMRKYHHRWDFTQFINLFRKHPLHIDRYNKYENIAKQ
eukprot:439437_1